MFGTLMKSSKFWYGVVGLVWAVVLYFAPAFPKEIKFAIDGLTAIVIGAIAVDEAQRMRADEVALRGLPIPKPGFIAQRFVWVALVIGVLLLLARVTAW